MQSTHTADRTRAIYTLKRGGRRLLVVDGGVIFISPKIRRRQLASVRDQLSDPSAEPTSVLGAEATAIPVTQVLSVTGLPDLARVTVETTMGTHRIDGWWRPPIVVGGEGISKPLPVPAVGAAAVEDFVSRVESLRSAPRHQRIQADVLTIEESRAARDQHEDLAFVPYGAIAHFVQLLLGPAALLGLAVFLALPIWVVIPAIALSAWELPAAAPAKLVVGPHGIVWGRSRARVAVPWRMIEAVDVVAPGFARPRLAWVDATTGQRFPIPVSRLMTSRQLSEMGHAVSTYRPFNGAGGDGGGHRDQEDRS